MSFSAPRGYTGFPFHRTLIAAAVASLSSLAIQAIAQDVQLEAVTVTATGYEQSVKDAPASITVITADEIAKKSYTDITDVLKNVPGVHIQGGGVEQSVMIRGMSADYTLFLVDGRPQQDNQAFALTGAQAGTPVNFLPPIEAIERIEVLRGPASSLYGADAIGGVVNIITKKVVNKFSGSVSTEYVKAAHGNDVTNDGFQTGMALNIPVVKDKLALQLTGSFHHKQESDYVGIDDSGASDPKFKRQNLNAKASLKIDSQNTVTLGGGHSSQERTHTPGRSLTIDDDASYSKSLRDNYFVTHEGRYKDMLLESYVNYETSKNPTRVNATTGNSINFDTLNANTQGTWFLGAHTLAVGANYKKEKLTDGASNGINVPGIALSTDVITMDRSQAALFAEDNWQLTDELALLLSGRYDHSSTFGGKISPKVYGVYNLSPILAIKGGMTTGYKTPSLRSAATDFGSTSMGGVIIGNPELKPETTRNFELGLNYGGAASGMSGSLTVYRTKFEDKIMRTGRVCLQNQACNYGGVNYPEHIYGYTSYINVDTAKLHGLEWTQDWKINKSLTYRHSYTYAKSEQTSGEYAGKPLNDVPEHMFNVTLDWRATNTLSLWTQVNYRGETSGRWQSSSGSAANGKTVDSYAFMDVGLVYDVAKDIKLKFGVYNLTNRQVVPEDGFGYVLDGRRYSIAANFAF